MQEANSRTGGAFVDRGARARTTVDVAFEDATSGLHRLADLDEGESLRQIVPADLEDEIRELYAEKRQELKNLGAPLNTTDFYRAPRSASAAA